MDEFGSEFKVHNMAGRPVFVREIDEKDYCSLKCASCGEPCNLIVIELDRARWSWCGKCHYSQIERSIGAG